MEENGCYSGRGVNDGTGLVRGFDATLGIFDFQRHLLRLAGIFDLLFNN
jgi:hypothetical protein